MRFIYDITSYRAERDDRLRSLIQVSFGRNCLSTANAAKMRGELGFGSSVRYGRIGRGMLRSLARRQYSSGGHYVDESILERLQFWCAFLGGITPRIASRHGEWAIPIQPDAMGVGRIGAKWRFGGMDFAAHTHLPKWIMDLTYK